MEKKVIIVSAFYRETLNSRPFMLEKYFKEKGCDVKVVCSDFSHSLKKEMRYRDYNKKIVIKTLKYRKNISLKRIISHVKFSLDAKKIVDLENPDLVYLNLPPNILGYFLTKNKRCKIIIDIIDLWPEALPIPFKIKRIFNLTFGKLWKNFRTYAIKKSDLVFTHVNYFYEHLNLEKKVNSKVIYLCKNSKIYSIKEKENNDIKIAYLGNISHIYDFESLIYIAKKINATIEIIGKGEKESWLIERLKEEKITYNFYGPIYDEKRKKEILETCDFGFNGYKNTTDVAMSYKSIDYFSYNLPIINSAKGDTWKLVEKYSLGFNYSFCNIEYLAQKIKIHISEKKINMKKNVNKIFRDIFTYDGYVKKMDEVLVAYRGWK